MINRWLDFKKNPADYKIRVITFNMFRGSLKEILKTEAFTVTPNSEACAAGSVQLKSEALSPPAGSCCSLLLSRSWRHLDHFWCLYLFCCFHSHFINLRELTSRFPLPCLFVFFFTVICFQVYSVTGVVVWVCCSCECDFFIPVS